MTGLSNHVTGHVTAWSSDDWRSSLLILWWGLSKPADHTIQYNTQQNLLEILGVIFDKNFTFHSHISAVCSSCFYHIWDLWCIRRYLALDSAKLFATALVSSCLSYCHSLLYGIVDTDLTKLQCIQNQLARFVTKSPPLTRSVPLLRSLHWLPVRFRILFKINLMTYKMLRENSLFSFTPCLPHLSYPVDWDQTKVLVCRSLKSRPTQVQELFTLVLRLSGTTFHCLSASVTSVATFKKHLKTHHFDLAFPP